MLAYAPRAVSARYDAAAGRVVMEMTNGCAYAFPPSLIEDLQGARDPALSEVVVDGAGFNLSWPGLGVDLFVPALVDGIFGTRTWMESEAGVTWRRRAARRETPASRKKSARL